MSKTKKKKNAKKGDGGRRAADILLSVLVAAGIAGGGVYVASGIKPVSQNNTYVSVPDAVPATEAPTDESKTIYQNEEHPNDEIYEGSLILVNGDTEYKSQNDDLVSVYDVISEKDCSSFSVRDIEVQTRREVAEHLVDLMNAFYAETGDDNVVILSGYRTREEQQALYDEDLAATGETTSLLVAKPGHSEHETGLGMDLSLLDGVDYDGTGIYEWITEHCSEYGFILRYPEDKVDVTGIRYEPWHLRYVGTPHADYMMDQGLCLEEYMDLLEQYPYAGEHLIMSDRSGKLYEVYYVAEESEFVSTMVPVPNSMPYTVAGNNRSGFIVTVEIEAVGNSPVQETGETGETAETQEDTTENAE